MKIIESNDTINQLVGRYLKSRRLEYGLTGAEMGRLLFISQQQVSRYERGINTISLSLVLFFLQKIELSHEDFFDYLSSELNKDNDEEDETVMGMKPYLNTAHKSHELYHL